MANRDCNGDFFTVEGLVYYRCLWDCTILKGLANGNQCPNCNRTIDADDLGEVRTRKTTIAILTDDIEVEIPVD